MPDYREYDVTITRTVTARVRVDDRQAEPILLAQDMGLVLWRDSGTPPLAEFGTMATETRKTSDTHTRVTVVDVTDR